MPDSEKLEKSPTKPYVHPMYTVTDIQRKVRVLDGTKVTYASWVNLFTLHARGYKVLRHIDGTAAPAKTDPDYASWEEVDAIVLQWIYGTMSDDLLDRVLEEDSTAQEAWDRVKNIFLNNKGARAASLESEFINLKLEAMPSFDLYCQRLRAISGQLKDVGAPVTDQRLVLQLVRGLPKEYNTVAAYINQTLPNFETARSMIELENHRMAALDGPPASALVAPAASPESRPWDDGSRPTAQKENNRPPSRGNSGRRNNRGGNRRGAPPQEPRPTTVSASPPTWGPTPPWFSGWLVPPCPYPTQPGWAPPWQPWSNPVPSSSRQGSRPNSRPNNRGYGQAYVTQDEFLQPSDLGQQYQALHIQQHVDNGQWFFDTGASSHLCADLGFSD